MKQLNHQPTTHVLVCVNQRDKHADMPCCADVHGQDIYDELKKHVRETGLTGKVWVTRTRCLGFCNSTGATVVFQPQQLWFTEVTMDDVAQLKEIMSSKL